MVILISESGIVFQKWKDTLEAEMFGVGDFWLETRVIIKIDVAQPIWPWGCPTQAQKGKKSQKCCKKNFENSFTFDTFKLFLPKNDYAFLHIIL